MMNNRNMLLVSLLLQTQTSCPKVNRSLLIKIHSSTITKLLPDAVAPKLHIVPTTTEQGISHPSTRAISGIKY